MEIIIILFSRTNADYYAECNYRERERERDVNY